VVDKEKAMKNHLDLNTRTVCLSKTQNRFKRIAKIGLWCMALACTSLSFAAEDEVVVLLGSEHALLPTHINPVTVVSTDLSQDYLSKLQSILTFDLDHNGMTRIVTGKEKEAATAAVHAGPEGSVDLAALRKLGLSYLIDWKIQGKDLGASVVQITSGTTRSISPVTCSGDLSKDRGRIHQLADCIFQSLFGKPGIANTKILYTLKKRITSDSSEPNIVSEIFETDYDGQNPRQLTHVGSMCTSPAWVPPRTPGVASADQASSQKSQTFLYVSYELGQPKIYAASLRDNRAYRVTTMRGNQLTPAIAQDGSAIAFCSDITGTADLYLVPFEAGVGAVGKPRQIFHAKGTATACPTFSPDGSKVAFVSNKDGAAKVYVMDIPPVGAKSADLHPSLISKRCRESTGPAWSPDGKKIAYSAKNSGERQIWIYDIENRTEQQLTDGKGNKESPSWAPDSMHLVFHAFTKDGCDLYMVNINQPTPVKITSGSGEKLFPSWEPRAQ
jgi:TolB protein